MADDHLNVCCHRHGDVEYEDDLQFGGWLPNWLPRRSQAVTLLPAPPPPGIDDAFIILVIILHHPNNNNWHFRGYHLLGHSRQPQH